MRTINLAIAGLDKHQDGREPRARLQRLLSLRAAVRKCSESERLELMQQIVAIQAQEAIRAPAKTTVSNQVQLIRRALRFVGQTTPGVPTLPAPTMPPSSPGRTRRPSRGELQALVSEASLIHPMLSLIIRFAVATGLRRERILEFRTSYIQELAESRSAIVFPNSPDRRKRAGIVPVTAELREILAEAALLCTDHDGSPQLAVNMRTLADIARSDLHLFQISGNVLGHAWRRLLAHLKIKGLRFHDLRHEATSRLFESGLTAAEVMSITGHSTTDMVDRYSHYSSVLVLEKMEPKTPPTDALEMEGSTARSNSISHDQLSVASIVNDLDALTERLLKLRDQLTGSK